MSVSLGWYYTFTYYGRAGWPMPMMEPCLALVLYYFSVLNVVTEIQALHWVLVFPLAGVIWVWALWLLAPRFGARNCSLDKAMLAFALTCLPMVLPLPYMSMVAAQKNGGHDIHHLVLVALRRAWVMPWSWLSPLYFALGLLSMGLQIVTYRKTFSARGKRAWLHYVSAAIAASIVACVIGALVAVPLRAGLE